MALEVARHVPRTTSRDTLADKMEGLVSSLRALAERDMNLKEVTAALEMHAQQKGIA